jgi:hypothetical protein
VTAAAPVAVEAGATAAVAAAATQLAAEPGNAEAAEAAAAAPPANPEKPAPQRAAGEKPSLAAGATAEVAPEADPDQTAELPEIKAEGEPTAPEPEKPAVRPGEAARAQALRGPDGADARPAMAATPTQPDAALASANIAAPAVAHAPSHAAVHSLAQPQHQPAANFVPVAGLAVEIAAQAQTGNNRFEIRLDPPELGRIEVRLEIDGDGQVTSHLRVERAETLDLLRRDAPALERALQQSGLKTSDSGLQFSLRDQSWSQQQQQQGRDAPAFAGIVVPDDKAPLIETQRHYGRLAGSGSGVDIRV